MDYIRPLHTLRGTDLSLAGGKGANLGELTRAGMNVPAGFVLTTAAYQACVPAPDHSAIDVRDLHALVGTAAAIRDQIEAAPLGPAISSAVATAYRDLGESVTVAVRSSATAEDLPGASFAGQQESYLHVTEEEAVLMAVRRCWASLWTDRAIRYRLEQGIDSSSVAMAVVVQAMAPYEVAGVVFTRNPITGRGDELLVNAVRGAGEQLVSGQVTPDQWVCGPDGTVRSFTPAPRPGVGLRPLGAGAPVRGCLHHGQVAELVRLARQVEAYFGTPQDIEWSYGQGRFYLLQARPITTGEVR